MLGSRLTSGSISSGRSGRWGMATQRTQSRGWQDQRTAAQAVMAPPRCGRRPGVEVTERAHQRLSSAAVRRAVPAPPGRAVRRRRRRSRSRAGSRHRTGDLAFATTARRRRTGSALHHVQLCPSHHGGCRRTRPAHVMPPKPRRMWVEGTELVALTAHDYENLAGQRRQAGAQAAQTVRCAASSTCSTHSSMSSNRLWPTCLSARPHRARPARIGDECAQKALIDALKNRPHQTRGRQS